MVYLPTSSLIAEKIRALHQPSGSASTSSERPPFQRSPSHAHDTLESLPSGSNKGGTYTPKKALESERRNDRSSLPIDTAASRGGIRHGLQVGKMSKSVQSVAVRLIREMRRNKAAQNTYTRSIRGPRKPPIASMLSDDVGLHGRILCAFVFSVR